ncbi:undecaprenyl-diphosphatase [Krasilnikovia cinnamomea]|uniref:Undecaprenyl-diphosphatase n=1 Tax=Krasilnikovia cinnamomea TaxID=349313 RepID=A0A4Q7ZUP9_9ACTN|nr:undecaprenyl-diphosphatase [Krasilnikovia cinnamomea]
MFVLFVGATGVALLAPGGLGEAQPQVVTKGASAELYRTAVASAAQAPGWLEVAGRHGAVAGLAGLALMLACTGWTGWRRRGPAAAGTVLVGVAAVVAYVGSEAVKLVVDEQRPCRVWGPLSTWDACPPVGDWSFPSNHATVAGAFAAGLVVLAPRWAGLTAPLAVLVAGGRVVTGVHYPHDVLAGLLWGASVTTAALVAGAPAAHGLLTAVRHRLVRSAGEFRPGER